MKRQKNDRSALLPRLLPILSSLVFALAASDASAGEDGTKHVGKSGATLYRENCSRCHAERYPTERKDAQWETIMLHMRVRAQLTGQDAEQILEYLTGSN